MTTRESKFIENTMEKLENILREMLGYLEHPDFYLTESLLACVFTTCHAIMNLHLNMSKDLLNKFIDMLCSDFPQTELFTTILVVVGYQMSNLNNDQIQRLTQLCINCLFS